MLSERLECKRERLLLSERPDALRCSRPPTPPAPPAEYCERGSVTEVLRAARVSGGWAAAQLTWARRLGMALDAAKGMM